MKKITIIIITLLLISVGYMFFFFEEKPKQMVEIGSYYDINGNLVGGYSVIGDVEGVKYITLKINIDNRDKVPLTFSIKEITPVDSARPTNKLSLEAGDSGFFETELIDIEPYEGSVQEFCVTAISEKIPSLREENELSGCISIKIDPNPQGQFDLGIDSQLGDSVANPGCEENWVCTEWSSCNNNLQTRTCTDSNDCGTDEDIPTQSEPCESTFQTNSNGDYSEDGVWIDFGIGKYYYYGVSTYDCLPENVFETTSEGNNICTRPGYEISDRVYLQEGGNGVIFKP